MQFVVARRRLQRAVLDHHPDAIDPWPGVRLTREEHAGGHLLWVGAHP
jgi:hypothetical protein